MNITVTNIPEEGLTRDFLKDGDWFHSLLPEKDGNDIAIERISGQYTAIKIGRTISVRGRLETEITLGCCRCLKEFVLPVSAEFKYTFVPVEKMSIKEELELTGEDLGFGYYKEDIIELDSIILEQIILQIPIKPLCDESCKGLCPRCGIDRNVEQCNHETMSFENPFAVLKQLKINNGKN